MTDCEWKGDNIVVMDEVTISPPYKPENCTGKRKDPLDRIKKMVRRYRDSNINNILHLLDRAQSDIGFVVQIKALLNYNAMLYQTFICFCLNEANVFV